MFRRYTCWGFCLLVVALAWTGQGRDLKDRGILICVSKNAPESIRKAAQNLAEKVTEVPALNALQKNQGSSGGVKLIDSETLMVRDRRRSNRFEKKAFEQAAYNHLVVVGLQSGDPLVKQTWSQQAAVDEAQKTFFMEGYGHLQGDIGYVESGRNPFLHSHQVRTATYDTCIFKITGTSETGVLSALKAFRQGMLNGVVPAGKLTRPEKTILDLDPSVEMCPVRFPLQVTVVDHLNKKGPSLFSGWTQVAANEYRAYLDQGGYEPERVWRLKSLRPNNFNRIDAQVWTCGFHRKAWGHALTVARFASSEQANAVAKAIHRDNRRWTKVSVDGLELWRTPQPKDEAFRPSYGSIYLTAVGQYVVFSGLPEDATCTVLKAFKQSSADKGVFRIREAKVPLMIDGKMDEKVWASAVSTGLFCGPFNPGDEELSQQANYQTLARMLWDSGHLYVGFICKQPAPPLATLTQRDAKLYQQDVAEIYLDIAGDMMQYAEIQVSPIGTVTDYYHEWSQKPKYPANEIDGEQVRAHRSDLSWNLEGFEAASAPLTANGKTVGWSVEMAIPVAPLLARRGLPWQLKKGQEFRLNLLRYYQKPLSSGKYSFNHFNWSKTMLGRPHISPMAMKTVVCVN